MDDLQPLRTWTRAFAPSQTWPRPGCATRAPRLHILPSDSRGTVDSRRKLQTRRGRQRYAWPMQTVEPVFGQIKQGRGCCGQRLLRGLAKVNGEWSLICTGHNLLKLFRFGVNLHRLSTGPWASPTDQELCRGSQSRRYSQSDLGAGRGNRHN